MNTHPTHMQVGGWGLWPMIVLGVGIPFLLLLWLLHACVFDVVGVVVVCMFFCVLLLLHVCVCVCLCVCVVSFSFPK